MEQVWAVYGEGLGACSHNASWTLEEGGDLGLGILRVYWSPVLTAHARNTFMRFVLSLDPSVGSASDDRPVSLWQQLGGTYVTGTL